MEHFSNDLSGEEWEGTVFYLTELDCLSDKLEFFRQLELRNFFPQDHLIHISSRGDDVLVRDYFWKHFVKIEFGDYIMANSKREIAVIPQDQMDIYTNLDEIKLDFIYLKL